MSKSNSESGWPIIILIGLVVVGVILYYSIVIAALVIPVIMFFYYIYASIQNFLYKKNFTGSIIDYWLNTEEKLEYKNIYTEHIQVAELIDSAYSKAKVNNISKNIDGSFSKRSRIGQEVQSIIDRNKPKLRRLDWELDELIYLPRIKWEAIHKYESKIKSMLGAFAIYIIILFYFSTKLAITTPLQILDLYQGLIQQILNGELQNISIDNDLIIMVISASVLSVLVYYVLKLIFTSLNANERNKIPLVSIENYNNPIDPSNEHIKFKKMFNSILLLVLTLIISSGLGFAMFNFISKDVNNAFVQNCSDYIVTTTQLNIRNQPTGKGEVVGTLNQSNIVCVYDFSGKWAKIDSGWISNNYLEMYSTISSENIDKSIGSKKSNDDAKTNNNVECTNYVVTATQLNIRKSPNNKGKVIGKVQKNDKVCVTETLGKWSRIDTGWISKKYIIAVDSVYVKSQGIELIDSVLKDTGESEIVEQLEYYQSTGETNISLLSVYEKIRDYKKVSQAEYNAFLSAFIGYYGNSADNPIAKLESVVVDTKRAKQNKTQLYIKPQKQEKTWKEQAQEELDKVIKAEKSAKNRKIMNTKDFKDSFFNFIKYNIVKNGLPIIRIQDSQGIDQAVDNILSDYGSRSYDWENRGYVYGRPIYD